MLSLSGIWVYRRCSSFIISLICRPNFSLITVLVCWWSISIFSSIAARSSVNRTCITLRPRYTTVGLGLAAEVYPHQRFAGAAGTDRRRGPGDRRGSAAGERGVERLGRLFFTRSVVHRAQRQIAPSAHSQARYA